MRVKLNEEEYLWRESASKYQDAHEEMIRRKNESAQVEEALFQVVQTKKPKMEFSSIEQVTRKQSVKKVFDFFKFRKK